MPSNPHKCVIPLAVVFFSTAVFVASDPAPARGVRQNEPQPAQTLDGSAALAVISIKDQRISLYDTQGGVVRGRISSGKSGYETPVGVFSVLQKKVDHVSNLYDDAQMPFMQRITWSGVALHAGVLPGYPASHGCVRLPYDFAERIFSKTKLGMRVVISRDDIAPVSIAHPLLPKPQPVGDVALAIPTAYNSGDASDESATILEPNVQNWPARQRLLKALKDQAKAKADKAKVAIRKWEALKADLKGRKRELALIAKRDRAVATKERSAARLAKAEKRIAKAKSRRAAKRAKKAKERALAALASAASKLADAEKAAAEPETVISKLKEQIAAAEAAKTVALAAAAEARRSTLPVSIFIGAKSQKLFVRQGNEPVFETKIAVADPNRSIGTHVFTALDFANEGNDVRWNVVSISRRSAYRFDEYGDRERYRRKRKVRSYEPPLTNAAAAVAALKRVTIPEEARVRISKYVWPGSSVIISDEELSKETGKATDFIVVASDEPHGALKKRPRQPRPDRYREYYNDGYYYYSDRRYYRYQRRRPRYNSFFDWW